jgi:DNA-binding NarL/FixJ family response regulator
MPVVRVQATGETDPAMAEYVRLLRSNDNLLVVGGTDEEHVLVIDETSPDPDVVLVDVPASASGLERVAEVRERHRSAKIVVLSPTSEPRHAQRALHNGADAYFVTPIDADELAHAVQLVSHGHLIIDGRVSGLRIEREPSARQYRDPVLREREVRTLQLAATGLADVDIARQLGTSRSAVSRSLKTASEKLGAENRQDAVQRVISARYLLGRSRRSYGIWDQERPGEPIERFREADRLLALLRHGTLVRGSTEDRSR